MKPLQMKQQAITVLITKPPHGSDAASQGLDTALACAAFDQTVTVIFQGDGVWQLLDQPIENPLGNKSLLAQFKLMELYGVTKVLACTESLADAALNHSALGLSAQAISPQQIAEHLATQTQVWVY